jgi:hypothetical protein
MQDTAGVKKGKMQTSPKISKSPKTWEYASAKEHTHPMAPAQPQQPSQRPPSPEASNPAHRAGPPLHMELLHEG